MRRHWLYPLAAATTLAPAAPWLMADDEEAGSLAAASAAGEVRDRYAGVVSCSGRGCHGAVDRPGTLGTELNTWANFDPHNRAYLALFNRRSETIQRRLGAAVPAPEDALCRSCHGRAEPEVAAADLRAIDRDAWRSAGALIGPSGVGCEDCHGAAGPTASGAGWLHAHYGPDWPEGSGEAARREKARRGMTDLGSVEARAAACARCHVGASLDQQVNHDLMAAGHPRLNFEFTLYSDRMPRHWDPSAVEDAGDAAGEWAVGRLATLRAALDLLADRAGAATADPPDAPWPEFTEYGCYSCHHSLAEGGLHYSSGPGRVPGSYPWSSWLLPMVGPLLAEHAPDAVDPLVSLQRLMDRPLPEPASVAERAAELSGALDALLASLDESGYARADLRRLLATIAESPEELERLTSNWDAASQLYLAMRALVISDLEAMGRAGVSAERLAEVEHRLEVLERIRAALEFAEGHPESPGPEGEPRHDSGDDSVAGVLRALLGDLTGVAIEPTTAGDG